MAWFSDECADKLCGLMAGMLLVGAGAVGGESLPDDLGIAESAVGAVGLAMTMLLKRRKSQEAVYKRIRRQVEIGAGQQLDSERPGWAEEADTIAAVGRLEAVAGQITFEAQAIVSAGLRADGVVRHLMLRAAEVEPLFHPDTGNETYRRIIDAALRQTFSALRADPDFWESLRPDIDEATWRKLDALLEGQAAMLAALNGIQRRLDLLVADLRLTAEAKERIAIELSKAQTQHNDTRTLILSFLEAILKREIAADRIPAELFALATNWNSAREQLSALQFSRNLAPELADLKDQAQQAFAQAELVGGEAIAEALRLVEAIEAKEIEAIGRLDADDARVRKEQEKLARQQTEISDERRLRVEGLRATLQTKLSIQKSQLDAKAAAETIIRIIDLEHADPDARYEALRSALIDAYVEGRDRGTRLPLEVAIELARFGLERARNADERGALANALGNALLTLGERESGTARLEHAVDAYGLALEGRTRDRVRLDWAMTQNNLGIALQAIGSRESGSVKLEWAVEAFRLALGERSRDSVPLDWATTQMNLGVALATLGERESGTTRLEQAIAAYRLAMTESTQDRAPRNWAATQNNMGSALLALGRREKNITRLKESVEAYTLALTEYPRQSFPLDWATTQCNLGNALLVLGQRESGTARLEQAVAAFRLALEEFTHERLPLDWAWTQMSLGNALQILGAREIGTARLEEAAEAFRLALEERSRDRVPLQWAMTQMNLGNALSILGERDSVTAPLEGAIKAYRLALEEYTHERVQLQWAETQYNLAIAFLSLFEKTRERAHLDEALAAVDGALEVYREATASYDIETAARLRERILAARDG